MFGRVPSSLWTAIGRVELKGDICTFEMDIESQDGSGDNLVITGEYDIKKDSLQAVYETGGKETVVFEYAATGDGYASQFYFTESDNPFLIKQAFDEKSLYAGMFSTSNKPESVYRQNIKLEEGFGTNDELMVVIESNKGYTIIQGERYDY